MAKRKRVENESENDEISTGVNVMMYVLTFVFKLRKWAVQNNISLMALTSLLKILREEGHTELPKDSRTLLRTPKKVKTTKIGKGEFWYRSLRKKLTQICKKKKCPATLELSIHIDGLPPYRSSNIEFWPIQCWIKGVQMKPFFVGLHLGRSKPSCLKSFLTPLLNDLRDLQANCIRTVNINGKTTIFKVKMINMILDAPARAFLKCIKGHSGYYSCERCNEEGVYLLKSGGEKKRTIKVTTKVTKKNKPKKNDKRNSGHVCLVGIDAERRTDESFRKRKHEEHHTGCSPLEELPIDMIGFFPVEYLHLILVGVMKKILQFWISGTSNFKTKLSSKDMEQISVHLIKAGETKPSEINRTSRRLNCVSNWKATEFRTFLLKTGPVVLKNCLPKAAYNHFLALHCATTICSSEYLLPYLSVAERLFEEFVENFGEIYGYESYCYNVHSLVHVTDDVERYGVLDNFSAFKGESNLASIKRMLRSGFKPLQQIVKRLMERESVEMIEEEVPKKKRRLHKDILTLDNLRLDTSERNRWILTKDNCIFKIKGFSQIDNNIQIHGAVIDRKAQKDLYDIPIQSSKLSVYLSKLHEKNDAVINLDEIHCKTYKIQVSSDEFAFFPLSHCTQ